MSAALANAAAAQQLPLEPFHQAGQSVTGAFEGWYPNQDGTFTLLFGYVYHRGECEGVEVAQNQIAATVAALLSEDFAAASPKAANPLPVFRE